MISLSRLLPALALAALLLPAQDLKLGIIGTDTSHVTAFPAILHDASRADHVPGARIVAAFKGGSPDLPSSADRVDKFAEELKTKHNVRFVDHIADLCPLVDALLLESVDGRTHLAQFREAARCGKPVFIDKPLAASWKDALEIARIARQANVPWFSTSSLRYQQWVTDLSGKAARGAITWGPGPTEKTHELDLGWYAIHPIEVLFAIMGPGCEKVSRISSPSGEVLTGYWKDGRIGAVRTLMPYGDYGAAVFGEKSTLQSPSKADSSYAPMLTSILRFFRDKQPPVPNDVTMEIFAFMEAANRSRAKNGALANLPSWK
ncbi:MAG: Gfo/Idh/MocA family oxidoreductase [Bryobacterales bacterium]|nr:Gfo/Idh/MocA family oxidoreductase [Bryobacterales bacterium]